MTTRNAQPGDTLIATFGYRCGPPMPVIVGRVTPTGRLILEGWEEQYNGLVGEWKGTRRTRDDEASPQRVRWPTPEDDQEGMRREREAWQAEQERNADRHQQVKAVRTHVEWFLKDSQTPYNDSGVRTYPYSQEHLNLLERLMTEMRASVPPEAQR